jgi:hypothetical protein
MCSEQVACSNVDMFQVAWPNLLIASGRGVPDMGTCFVQD